MKILIEKDSSTKVHKEVAGLDEAQGFAFNGFAVSIENEDGSFTPLAEVLAAAAEPAEDADAKAAAKPVKKAAAKKK